MEAFACVRYVVELDWIGYLLRMVFPVVGNPNLTSLTCAVADYTGTVDHTFMNRGAMIIGRVYRVTGLDCKLCRY